MFVLTDPLLSEQPQAESSKKISARQKAIAALELYRRWFIALGAAIGWIAYSTPGGYINAQGWAPNTIGGPFWNTPDAIQLALESPDRIKAIKKSDNPVIATSLFVTDIAITVLEQFGTYFTWGLVTNDAAEIGFGKTVFSYNGTLGEEHNELGKKNPWMLSLSNFGFALAVLWNLMQYSHHCYSAYCRNETPVARNHAIQSAILFFCFSGVFFEGMSVADQQNARTFILFAPILLSLSLVTTVADTLMNRFFINKKVDAPHSNDVHDTTPHTSIQKNPNPV